MDVTSHPTHWPTALLPALRQVWGRSLFPGAAAQPGRPSLLGGILLLVVPALFLYPRLDFRLLDPDEGRYAEIPREMLAADDWIVPRLQGEPYLDKPPLLYWLVMLSYQAFGTSAASARLVPALAIHACIIATYLFGCRWLGPRAALRGAILLALMPGLAGVGRILTLDGLLTLWVAVGLFAGFHWLRTARLGWLFAAACGLGVLTKGPIALVLVLVPLAVWRQLYRPPCVPVTRGVALRFIAVVAVINLPWYALICWRQPGFARYFFWQHNVERFFNPFDHLEPFWYYAPILLAGLFPMSLFAASIVRGLFSSDVAAAQRRSPELAFVLIAGGFCVGFFSLSGSKLPTYILPAIPPLGLALGTLLSGDRWFTRAQTVALAVWAVVFFAANSLVLPEYARLRSPLRDEATVRRYCADPSATVVCYPRHCDSLAFYLQRDDLKSTRSKHAHLLIQDLLTRPRTVVLFTHRHSLQAFTYALPKELRITPVADFRKKPEGLIGQIAGEVPWGLCDMAVVERVN